MDIHVVVIYKLILILTFITVFSISLHAAKYDNKVDPTELYEKATKHLKAEDYRKALRVLGKYTKSKPKDPDGWTLYAFAQRKLKNYKKAETNYEKALKLDPENKIALEYQGELYLQLGDIDQAKRNLEKINEICWLICKEKKMLKNAIDLALN